jgi:hypothetical protein
MAVWVERRVKEKRDLTLDVLVAGLRDGIAVGTKAAWSGGTCAASD